MVPIMTCITMPAIQLLRSINPSIRAISMWRPIMGATTYIIEVMTTVPRKPPTIERIRFGCIVTAPSDSTRIQQQPSPGVQQAPFASTARCWRVPSITANDPV